MHPEAQEDDILDKFSDFGHVNNINVNLDRRTGFAKVSNDPIFGDSHWSSRHYHQAVNDFLNILNDCECDSKVI